jgi:uncharacterized protein (DUF697 family)
MTASARPSPYEKEQIARLRAWRDAGPGVAERAVGRALSPIGWMAARLVPPSAFESLLRASDWLAERLVTPVARGQDAADELPLERLDAEARAIRNWAMGLAGGEGALAGAAGLISLPLDLPALVTLSLRTIRRIGAVYDFGAVTEDERQFVYAVLSVASANSLRQKQLALKLLRGGDARLLAESWVVLGERAARRAVGAEATIPFVRDLAERLGVNLSRRKAVAAVPIIGAAIGATANAWYMRDIGDTALRAFQERWLRDRGLLED